MKIYACIKAEGSGERFWPLIRTAKTKDAMPVCYSDSAQQNKKLYSELPGDLR